MKTEEPNQSPEPTPPAGTSAAEQPLVPAAAVAHLGRSAKTMKAINRFLVSQNVDVGRSFSLLALSSAVGAFFGMLGQWLTGRFSIDLSLPIGLFVGIALWLHVSWARTLLVFLGWLVVATISIILAGIPFTGTGKLSLNFGSTVIQHPPLWQPYVFAAFATPVLWFVLAVLHSEKARTEFQEPNQSPEPTGVLGTSAAEPPRVPSTPVAHL